MDYPTDRLLPPNQNRGRALALHHHQSVPEYRSRRYGHAVAAGRTRRDMLSPADLAASCHASSIAIGSMEAVHEVLRTRDHSGGESDSKDDYPCDETDVKL